MYWGSRRVSERRNLPFKEVTKAAANAALETAAGKLLRLATDYADYFPLYTDHGRWQHGKAAWTNWCEGFLGGQMWLFYELELGDEWKARAEHYSKLVEERQYDDEVHDLGFVLCPTWKKWWLRPKALPCSSENRDPQSSGVKTRSVTTWRSRSSPSSRSRANTWARTAGPVVAQFSDGCWRGTGTSTYRPSRPEGAREGSVRLATAT